LRHEFVHRLNLEQTRFQVPHWLTEGLAVEAEERPRPSDWTRLIAQRHREGKLFTLADINFGFIRPASSREWTLAYAQAELYIEFMRKQYGGDSVAKLLHAIAENYTTAEAIAQATKVTIAEFEAGYKAYVSAQVAQWNLSQAVVVDHPAPLQAALAKSPDDVALRANLAAAYLGKGELVLARRYATEALESKSSQQTAAFVLASLAAQTGNMAEAERIAQSHVSIAQPHPDLLLLLATSKLAGKQYPLAEKLLLLGRKHFPSLDAWEENLAKLYAIQKDHAKLQPILESLTWCKEDDAALPAKLMELAWEANDAAATERWAMATLRVNVNHDAAHAYRGMALADLKRQGESLAEFAAISKDAKMQPAWKLAFARVLLATGNRDRAKELVEGLIMSAPDLPGLLELARELEK
jgi:predicted Zn-dependent protease